MTTRREFIKFVGLTLASLVAAGVIPACGPSSEARHSAWNALRLCWLSLWQSQKPEDMNKQKDNYQAALKQLVAAHEISAEVSAQLWQAYEEAIYYYSLPPVPTCYVPTMPPIPTATPLNCYVPTPTPIPTMTPLPASCYEAPAFNGYRSDLVWRLAALEDMAAKGNIEAKTVTEMRTELERELSLFEAAAALQSLDVREHIQAEDQLMALIQDGKLEISPEAAQAADILVNLLLGKK